MGRLEDSSEKAYYTAVYKGEEIVPAGSAAELRKSLDSAWGKSGDDLIREMEEMKRITIIKNSGSGGDLEYLKVLSRNMIKQEEKMSCAAACIKQIAQDNGLRVSESKIRLAAGTTKSGTSPIGIMMAMEDLFEGREIIIKSYFRNPDNIMSKIAKDITKDGSWIAEIHPKDGIKHTIIVDKIIGNDVYIRDPWPLENFENGINGVEAIINLEVFSYA